MSYPIANIDGIGPEEAHALKRLAIRTTGALLEAAKSPKRLLKWANAADRMRIKGVGDGYAELIRAAGVDTVRELRYRNAKRLTEAMRNANTRRKLVDFLP